MTSLRAVLDHILESISPASEAQAYGARQRLATRTAPRDSLGSLETLAARVAAARHAPSPRVDRKVVLVFAADHGVSHPGVDLGENSPTIIAVRHISSGKAAVNATARTAGARLVILDCGVRGAERYDLGPGVLDVRSGDCDADITTGPAMNTEDALSALQTGIAVVFSLADEGVDVIALGHVGVGSEPVSGAVVTALTRADPASVGPEDAAAVSAALAANSPSPEDPIDVLAKVGSGDIGVMAGVLLGAASINVPIVLDSHATWAAALIASRLAPAMPGYLIASHAGGSPGQRLALDALGLSPLFDLGLSHGEGAGAALALPMVDAAAQLLAR